MIARAIQRIAVLGAGTMGQGIAQTCATAGYDVLLYDINPDLLKESLLHISKNLDAAILKNKLSPSEKEIVLGKIIPASEIRQLQVDLVIEAVVEKIEIKQEIFLALEKINTKDCLFTSNTSSLSITKIADVLLHKNRFAGLHFFNPAPVMKLVEIIEGASTDPAIIPALKSFVLRLKKVAVLVKDSPGFIVNRVARPYYLEAFRLVEEGITDFNTIDKLLQSAGFKMGPFALIDLIGMDINFAVTTSVYEAFHKEPRFKPSVIQSDKISAGHLGKKSGKGFYTY